MVEFFLPVVEKKIFIPLPSQFLLSPVPSMDRHVNLKGWRISLALIRKAGNHVFRGCILGSWCTTLRVSKA